MSDYKAQLHGWAWDRAVEAIKAGVIKAGSLAETNVYAQEIADLFYRPEKEFEATTKYLSELIQKSDNPLEKIKFLQNELAFAEEQIGRVKAEVVQ